MAALSSRRLGSGPPVVLLHGWSSPNAGLHVPDRVGYGASAGLADAEDFDLDAELLAAGKMPNAAAASAARCV